MDEMKFRRRCFFRKVGRGGESVVYRSSYILGCSLLCWVSYASPAGGYGEMETGAEWMENKGMMRSRRMDGMG